MKKIFLLIIFIFLLSFSFVNLQTASLVLAGINDNLVSYWKFDEGVVDTCAGNEDVCDSQGSNHGEISGAGGDNNLPQWSDTVKPTLATSNPYAMNFDGFDDRVTGIGDINFSGNAFSVAAWIRPESWGVYGDSYIHNLLCDETASASTFCFRIGSRGESGYRQRIALMIYDSSPNDYESSSDLSLNSWQHVAVTFDGSNVRFYIGGTLNRTQSANITMNDGTQGFHIAASNTGERNYDGSIDELRVYDRAITADEVEELAGVNPGVNTLSPTDDAVDVSKTSNLVIDFNRDMQAITAKNIYLKETSGDTTVETIAADNTSLVSISGSTVTIDPTNDLNGGTSYYVLVDSGAFTDLSSNIYSGISDSTTWNFTTQADPTATPTPTTTPTPNPSSTPTPTATPTPVPTSTPTPTPNSSSSSDSSSSNSSTSQAVAPVCSDSAPSGKPDLFQIDTTENSATLFFTPVLGISKYYISYSDQNSNAEQHGVSVDLGSLGVQNYTINLLNSGQTYYFKVRGQNGCMPGGWSNIRSAVISSNIILENFDYDEEEEIDRKEEDYKENEEREEKEDLVSEKIEDDKTEIEQQSEDSEMKKNQEKTNYKVTILVQEEEKPKANAKVVIQELAKEVVTDDKGQVVIEDVPEGKYSFKLVDQAYAAEETVDIQGDDQEFDVVINLKVNKPLFSTPVWIGILAITILGSWAFLKFKFRYYN